MHRNLLAYLLIHRNVVVSVEQMIEAMWGGSPPNTARGQLHNAISTMRGSIFKHGNLSTKNHGYLLTLAADQLDLTVFENRLKQAREAEPQHAAEILRDALSLWLGEPLAGIGAPFADATRFLLNEQRLSTWERLAAIELSLGRHDVVIPELAALVAAHPLYERLTEHLMLALYRSGRQAAALAAGRDLRSALAEQGLEPGPSFVDVELAILRADPALALTVAPEQSIVPAQLPADLPDFTGRAEELNQLTKMMRSKPLAVITGSGGMGKTALAVRWAHEEQRNYPDGQLYLNLHGYSCTTTVEPEVALARFLRALGVDTDRIPTNADEAAGMFRTLLADRRMLIVLDNAASAEQVRPLLPNGASVVLVTSRDSLHGLVVKDGAARLELATLTAADSRDLLERVLGAARVHAGEGAFAQIAERCGHLPLALRISAAQLADQSTADYLGEDVLSALTIEGDSTTCVRASFDLSYQRLDEPERRLFRLLSLIPGPDFTLAEATALMGENARRSLDRLTTAHLIQRSGPGRHTFHDLLRWYARENALPTEQPDASKRLHQHYFGAADAATRLLFPHSPRMTEPAQTHSYPDKAAALSWLEAERANLVAAMGQGAWQLAGTLRAFFYMRPHPIDRTVDWPTASLAAANDPAALISAHHTYALHHRERSPLIALTHNTIALNLADEHNLTEPVPALLTNLGSAHHAVGRLRQAHASYSRAVAIYRERGLHEYFSSPTSGLGIVSHLLGDSATALDCFNQALGVYRRVGNINGQMDTLRDMGVMHLDGGDPKRALELAEEALALIGIASDRLFEAEALNLVGTARIALGQYPQALAAHEAALQLLPHGGSRVGEIQARIGLAEVHGHFGRLETAVAYGQSALAQAQKLGYRLLEAEALIAIGKITGNREYAEQALAIHRETEYVAGQERATRALRHHRSQRTQSGHQQGESPSSPRSSRPAQPSDPPGDH